MNSNANFDPFGFLTTPRQQIFRTAIASANSRHQALLDNSAHIYPHLSKIGKAFDTRDWGIGFIMEAFSLHTGVKRREINNISGIEFDNEYFVYFKMIKDLDLLLVEEPMTIIKARKEKELPRQETYLDIILPQEEQAKTIHISHFGGLH